eukprot:m.327640 g.327640  ORF g.327640 m.327640 type:complete len:211 (+) comp20419_c0_seq2:350-982(+)
MSDAWKNPLASRYRNRQKEAQAQHAATVERADVGVPTPKKSKSINKNLQAYNPEIFKPSYSVEAVLAKNAVADRMLVDDAMAMLEEDKKEKARQRVAQAQRERDAQARAAQRGAGGAAATAAARTPRGPGVLPANSRGGALSKPSARNSRSPTTPSQKQSSLRPNAPPSKPVSTAAKKANEDMEKIMPTMMSMKFRGVQRAARQKAEASQ